MLDVRPEFCHCLLNGFKKKPTGQIGATFLQSEAWQNFYGLDSLKKKRLQQNCKVGPLLESIYFCPSKETLVEWQAAKKSM